MPGIRTSGKEGNIETRHVDLYASERAMDEMSNLTLVRKTLPGLGPSRHPNFRTLLPPVALEYRLLEKCVLRLPCPQTDPLVRHVSVSTQSLKVTFPSPQRTTSPPTSAHPTRHPISLPSPTTTYVTPLPPTPPYVPSTRLSSTRSAVLGFGKDTANSWKTDINHALTACWTLSRRSNGGEMLRRSGMLKALQSSRPTPTN
jgi:hypothetical protein